MRPFTLLLFVVSILGCSAPTYYAADQMIWTADGIAFGLSDGRIFIATAQDNPQYLHTDQRRYRGVKEVYFPASTNTQRLSLKGTGAMGMGDITFRVKEVTLRPGEGMIDALRRGE